MNAAIAILATPAVFHSGTRETFSSHKPVKNRMPR